MDHHKVPQTSTKIQISTFAANSLSYVAILPCKWNTG